MTSITDAPLKPAAEIQGRPIFNRAPLRRGHSHRWIVAMASTLFLLPGISRADQPPQSPDPAPPCDSCEDDSGGTSPPANNSLDWRITAGLGRYEKPASLSDLAKIASEKNGNLPSFKELYGRFFSSSPLQQRQLVLEIVEPQLSAATFHPSCVFLRPGAMVEKLTKPAADGFPEFIHQLLTDDTFVLIDTLPSPDSGWRLRVWKRNAATLTKLSGYYVTTGFVTQTPLTDVIFKRPSGSTLNNTLIYIQKETTGLAGTRTVTSEIVQTVDGNGKPATVISKLFSGEGTSGPLLSQENLTYSERITGKIWDYTIVREVRTSSVDAAGNIGTLTLTEKTRENYDDYSPARYPVGNGIYIDAPYGGAPGMKRLVSKTDAYNVSGQSPQTTIYTYISSLENPAINGRVLSVVRPDGSWTYNEYAMFPDSPQSVITEYSGWKDLTISQRSGAGKKVTTVNPESCTVDDFVGSQLVGKSQTSIGTLTSETQSYSSQWDGSAWRTTATAYYLDSAAAPSTGRIKWIEKSDGTAETYAYATVSGDLVMTVRTGAGSRTGITAGTEVTTTYGVGNIPVAQNTKDIASGLYTEQWVTDTTYNGGFDAIGRPIKRIYNADVNDYDISQYACCGLEFSRDRMGATTTYGRDGLKRVYKVETKASAASPVVATFTTVDGLTTTRTRRFGSSAALFLGSTTRSLDGLTTTETGPSRKSTLVADRPVTTTVTTHSATGDTETTTYADLSTSITSNYLDGRTKSVGGTAVPDKSYDYTAHNENGGGEKTIVTASGVVTSTFTDLLDRTRKTVSGATGTTTYAYHPVTAAAGSRGKLQSTTDGDSVAVSYGYNGEGERTTTSRTIPFASGTATQVTTTTRDVFSGPTLHGISLGTSFRQTQTVASTGVPAITTSLSYADIGGLVSGSEAFGRQTLTVRTRANPTSGIATETTTNPDGTKTVATTTHDLTTESETKSTTGSVITGASYTYDAFQRPDSMTELRTGATTYSNFTEAGKPLTTTTNNNTDATSVENDIMGRVVKTTLPDATVKHTAYHPTGQVKVTWGSQTYPTWNVYDEQNRQTQLHTWKTAPTLNPASIPTNPPTGSDVTTWIYGATTGHLVEKNHPGETDNGIIDADYTYTLAGRLQTRVWERGVTTTYGYTHGLMTSTNYSDSTPDVSITYEPLGRQSTVTQTNQSQIACTYDSANLAIDTETIRYDLDHNGSYEFTRVLDRKATDLGRDKGWELKNGTTIENQATYGYHATDGRLLNVVGGGDVSSPQTFSYGYTPNSNLIQTVTGPVHTVTNTWEPHRDVLDIKQNKVGTDVISKYDYLVNGIGQRKEVATSGTAFPATPSWLWGYDSLGQVTSADSSVATSDRAYQYDTIGNRKKSAESLTLPSTDNYTSNALNQYSSLTLNSQPTTLNPSYDFDGNATAYPLPVAPTTNSVLAWDGENRQISSTVGSTTTTYLYDAQSRRIAKSTGGATIISIYDAWNCIAEYTQSAPAASIVLSKTRLWGTDLSGTQQGAGGVGGLLAEIHHSGTAVTYYPTCDGNGNVSEYLASNGNITAHFEYDPFGNTVVASGSIGLFDYRFSTKLRDSESGFFYYGYRYYDPVTGRWPSRDPIGESGGVNLYGFLKNDSLENLDVLGLQRLMKISAIGTANISITCTFQGKSDDCCPKNTKEDITASGDWVNAGQGAEDAAKLSASFKLNFKAQDTAKKHCGKKCSGSYEYEKGEPKYKVISDIV